MQNYVLFFIGVASVWAENIPLILNKKVNGKVEPVSYFTAQDVSLFSGRESRQKPPEFSLIQGIASINCEPTPGNLGFLGTTLAFGPKIDAVHLELADDGMIIKPKIFWCILPGINYERYTSEYTNDHCYDAGLYLLPAPGPKD